VGETNLLQGDVIERGDGTIGVQTAAGLIVAAAEGELSGRVVLSIRPEQMRRSASDGSSPRGVNRLSGRVAETTFLGEASEHVLMVNGQRIKWISAPPLLQPPEELTVEFDPRDAIVLPRSD
jgi:hypothetical protein